jgi:hypothetical protein
MLNPQNIPSHLHHRLLPLSDLVKQFGVTDDGERLRALKLASPDEVSRLRRAIFEHDDAFDEWLAGPEADGPTYTDEYIAFSAMRMAADMA